MKRKIWWAALLSTFGMFGMVRAATTINEVEPNNTPDVAQLIDLSQGVVTINGRLGDTTPDVDLYKFFAHAGDVLTFDIDGGMVSGDFTTDRDVDTKIAIFDATTLTIYNANTNDDAPDLDPGSTWSADARLDSVQFDHDGYYIVGVTSNCNFLRNTTRVGCGSPFDVGQYTLVITPPAPPVLQVSIDIVPGRSDVVPLNQRFEGEIPVAILSSKDFDATKVDVASLTFGATGDEQSLRHCRRRPRDTNRDSLTDMVCHFTTTATGFEVGDTQGVLRGKTTDGRKIEGHGALKVIAEKRRHDRYPHVNWLPEARGHGHDHDH